MPKITFITCENETISVEGTAGSLMQLAIDNDIKGIDGDCGGVCSCATCHVFVHPDHFEKTGAPGEIEKDMLELDDNVTEYSRLCCQLEINDNLDGLIVTVAQ